ncbi:hypothetical protein BDR26DRAFT_853441 [Obelidium mucronatum]|nr:hypothetical protein BDR26DRAFT_853441 [Obelidium mucronatum]
MSDFTAATPTEVLQQVFSWIPPLQTFALRRLNRRINSCLTDPYFASLNVHRNIPTSTSAILESISPNDLDKAIFAGPDPYPSTIINQCYTSVIRIVWERKRLQGTIPSAISKMKDLHFLSLSFNDLTGGIPTELGSSLINLRYLTLARTPLGGEIPKSLGNLVNVEYVALNGCKLVGCIPEELGLGLHRCNTLYLSGNQLTGEIPASLGRLKQMERLHLSSNALKGCLPKELGELTSLTELLLHNNQLEGEIPEEFSNLLLLEHLDVSKNALSGKFPTDGFERNGVAVGGRLRTVAIEGNKIDLSEHDVDRSRRAIQRFSY